ncbi:hypothetical protein RND81_01G116200 [Saponaria officinalis]|uniref:Uncharacterized protein n=1 Tax=Saponaria officinalis TaxID=3572 RepID=A0AAW1N9H8_SAPOF
MEGKSIVVCKVVAILGLFSTVVGLVFELAPDKTMVRLFHFSWMCDYFRSAAFFLVLAALICVILAQIIITISTDCGCCSGRSFSALQALAILGFCFSWLASIAAVIVYVIGGAKQYGVQFPEFSHLFSSLSSIWAENGYCYKAKHGIFGAAAALSFAAFSLGIVTYAVLGFGYKRRRITGVRVTSSTNEVHNHGDAPSPMDSPIAIALPDVPATPVQRFKAVERHQNPTDLRPTPVMLQV